jgi:hypothetical protein
MLWSAVMWFNNMKGIHNITLHNLTTSCLARIFLCVQKGIRKMRLCTTEPLEHQFGTARSHKREFTARDFCLFVDNIGTIFTHISKFYFNATTSDKGYMSGFHGFMKTVSNITKKSSANTADGGADDDAIDVDYSRPIATQIESLVIEALQETQGPMLHLMATLGFDVHESDFNHLITSCVTSFEVPSKIFRGKTADEGSREKISAIVPPDVAHLAALDLTSNDTEEFVEWDTDTDLSTDASAQVLYDERGNSDSDDEKTTAKEWSFFDKGSFYDFLHADIIENSIDVLLTAMQTTISEVGQKKKGSVLTDEKAMSLKGRWFQVKKEGRPCQ